MKTLSNARPMLLAVILGVGFTAAWVTIVATSTMLLLPREIDENIFNHGSTSILLPSPVEVAIWDFFLLPKSKGIGHTQGQADFTYSWQLHLIFGPAIFSLILTIGISIPLAIWTFYRHQRLSKQGAPAWAIFVLPTGVPGLIGYLLHRRWPPMECCQTCHKETPRDRDACLHCGAEFSPPAMKGIEIFA